ncbi:hypothetical protein [Joostella atrarenae]|uniref:hypothetical protein n=1 Tax=Joostella atrarenae TaxID=679257 RepID=UPI00293E7365|nr:hypothetical protein [Joostella atrarenae]
MAFAIYQLPKEKNITKKINLKYWLIFVELTFVIILIRLLSGLEIIEYGNVIVSSISAGILSLILTSIILNKKTVYNNVS